ncbi:carboxypeptidase-like regulatory domain-containing protein [Haloarchaeobius sp. HRN-SO-5]|uniref:carboxypeptidase-like regulatory domain-containing protein n=1 Tax=Haloarchaeobius sp. HRN-SO-5 TaxID=3446118 RepID=UPI003EBCF7F3
MRLTVVLAGLVLLVAPVAGVAATQTTDTTADDVALRVTVVNAQGSALGNAEVTVSYDDQERTRETFSNGETLFDVPDGASVEVFAEHPMLVMNDPVTVDIDGNTEVTVTMYQPATTTVFVQDASGDPVADANVWLRKDGASRTAARGTSGPDGTFSTPEIESGDYSIHVTKTGYYDGRLEVTLSDESEQTVEIAEGRVSVDFSVVDPEVDSGDPIQDATITVADGQSTVGTFSTDNSGSRGVTLDVNTEYTVSVEKDGYESVNRSLRIEESDTSATFEMTRTPELTVEPANTQVVVGQDVRISVTDEYDRPVAGADIRADGTSVATTDENGEAMVTIDQAGEFEIDAVNGSLTSSAVVVEGVEPRTDAPSGTTSDATSGTTEPPTDGGPTPGFGVVVALVALAAVALVARGRP